MSHRGFFNIFIIGIIAAVVLIGAGIGGYLVYDAYRPPVISKIEKHSSIDTSTWKTYRNEKYRFEVQYPENWMTSENLDLNTTFYFLGPKKGVKDIGGDQIDFELSANPRKLPLIRWIEENTGFMGTDEEIIVGNARGIKRIGSGQISGESTISIFFIHDDKIFSFSAVGPENIEILNQILSTFKFVELNKSN